MRLDGSLPRKGLSENARVILNRMETVADARTGIGECPMRDLLNLAICDHKAAVIALQEIESAGDGEVLQFKDDRVYFRVVGRDPS